MAKKKPQSDQDKLFRLQMLILNHCTSLREVADHLTTGNTKAAVKTLNYATKHMKMVLESVNGPAKKNT